MSMYSVSSIFVAGQSLTEKSFDGHQEAVQHSLREVLSTLSFESKKLGVNLRLLAGTETPLDQVIADVAESLKIPIHLISAGVPHSLSLSQANAERQIWLGAEVFDKERQKVRNQIALGFSNYLLIVWNGEGQDEDVVTLLLNAALAMKFVIWVDQRGLVRVLERTKLTQSVLHLVDCPCPNIEQLKQCFTEALSNHQVAKTYAQSAELIYKELISKGNAPKSGDLSAGKVHKFMMALTQGKFKKMFSAIVSEPLSPYRGPAWSGAKDLIQETPHLDEAFDCSDILASIAADKHRSAVWISSLASTGAVFAAVAGAINLWVNPDLAFWSVLELVLVTLIIFLLWRSQKLKWHSVWIGSRFLAEQLRYARLGLPLMVIGKTLTKPAFAVFPNSDGQNELCLVSEDLLKIQHSLAHSGLPASPNGKTFVATTPQMLSQLQQYVLSVIKDQVTYHKRVHHENHTVEHMLHRFSLVLFTLTVVAIGAHFWLHADWLLIFTAFFPALASGIHGLSTSLEISRLSEQSESTVAELEDLKSALEIVLEANATPWQRWLHLRHLTLLASEVMSDENSQWQKLVTHQKPKLPA